MQNTVRWRYDRLDGAVVGSFWGTPDNCNQVDKKILPIGQTKLSAFQYLY